jgi:2-ketoarginine methyltransferase
VRAVIIENNVQHRTILDVGCGDAQLLCQVVELLPDSLGIGIDPSPAALAAAAGVVQQRNLQQRVTLLETDALGMQSTLVQPDIILAAFTLQEVLGTHGEAALIAWLSERRAQWPTAKWIVIEPDYQPQSSVLRTEYGLGYYNPYYLLHSFTKQKLMTRDEWLRLFALAGFEVLAIRAADCEVDPTGLELGFLLQPILSA